MSATTTNLAVGIVSAAAVAALAWFLATRSAVGISTEAPPVTVTTPPAATADPPISDGNARQPSKPEPAKTWKPPASVPDPVREPADRSRYLALPDGTFVEPLNGVERPKPFLWPKDIPFAKIVGKELDSYGYWWYVHADGSKSTTYKGQNPLTGQEESVTMIANPKEPLPIRNEELPGPRNPGK